jgi:hypothetical protein
LPSAFSFHPLGHRQQNPRFFPFANDEKPPPGRMLETAEREAGILLELPMDCAEEDVKSPPPWCISLTDISIAQNEC